MASAKQLPMEIVLTIFNHILATTENSTFELVRFTPISHLFARAAFHIHLSEMRKRRNIVGRSNHFTKAQWMLWLLYGKEQYNLDVEALSLATRTPPPSLKADENDTSSTADMQTEEFDEEQARLEEVLGANFSKSTVICDHNLCEAFFKYVLAAEPEDRRAESLLPVVLSHPTRRFVRCAFRVYIERLRKWFPRELWGTEQVVWQRYQAVLTQKGVDIAEAFANDIEKLYREADADVNISVAPATDVTV